MIEQSQPTFDPRCIMVHSREFEQRCGCRGIVAHLNQENWGLAASVEMVECFDFEVVGLGFEAVESLYLGLYLKVAEGLGYQMNSEIVERLGFQMAFELVDGLKIGMYPEDL